MSVKFMDRPLEEAKREGLEVSARDKELRHPIAEYLLKNRQNERMRLLSLPNLWEFERILLEKTDDKLPLSVYGVENDLKTFRMSSFHIPERRGRLKADPPDMHGHLDKSMGPYYTFETNDKLRYYYMGYTELEDWLECAADDDLVNAVWLDFCGTIAEPVLRCIDRLGRVVEDGSPVVITVMKGRRESVPGIVKGSADNDEERIWTIAERAAKAGYGLTPVDAPLYHREGSPMMAVKFRKD